MRFYDTMIALVSDQRMQNIIPLFQKNLMVGHLVLVVSLSGQQRNQRYLTIAEEIRTVFATSHTLFSELDVTIAEAGVVPFNISAGQEVIELLLGQFPSDRVVVNITGGTKPMSIAAYAAARQRGVTALYLDSAGEQLVWLQADDTIETEPLDIHPITVEIALAAHGRTIDWNQTYPRQPSKQQLTFIRALNGSFGPLKRTINQLRHIRQTRYKATEWPLQIRADQLLINRHVDKALRASELFEFTSDTIRVSQSAWHFLMSGQWLEAYVYIMLIDSGLFDNVQINVCLTDIPNELDIVCTSHGKLALIECKTGRDIAEQQSSGDFQAILHRAHVLKETLGGIFARTFLVSQRTGNQVAEPLRLRAEEYGIEIITSGQLRTVGAIVHRTLSVQS